MRIMSEEEDDVILELTYREYKGFCNVSGLPVLCLIMKSRVRYSIMTKRSNDNQIKSKFTADADLMHQLPTLLVPHYDYHFQLMV
jgi:hypothetical protein